MKKLLVAGILASMLLAGCGSAEKTIENAAESANAVTGEATMESGEATADAAEEKASADAALPAYEYQGEDSETAEDGIMKACIAELMKLDEENFDPAEIAIPAPVVYQVDSSDESDIKVWGEFYIFNYDLKGDTLETQSGGNFRGCMHLMKEGEDYQISSFDQVEDGSDEAESLRQICEENEELLAKFGNDEQVNEVRKNYISAYVKANDLNIKSYQDSGWDPVDLEN